LKRVVGVSVLGAILGAGGCSSPPHEVDPSTVIADSAGAPPANPHASEASTLPEKNVIAQINGQPITLDEVMRPLLEWRGLALMLNVAQLDVAKQDMRDKGLTVTPDDIKAELDKTLEKMFSEQPERDRGPALEQFLEKRNYSRAEFDIVVEINAYLRKAAMEAIKGKITDDEIEKEFGREYGETAKCRVIVLGNAREITDAQTRLKAGEDFAEVARTMSHDPRTAPLGGEIQPFSLQTQGIPDQFRQLAFTLQEGQISDPLNIGESWYLIKLEHKFPPKAVKFQNVKESLRKSMYDKAAEFGMNQLRENLGAQVMQQLSIHDPLLARQFDDLKARQLGAIKDREKMAEQMRREREAATQPTSQPASDLNGPTTAPAMATQPATR
jgi:parvulin-like peptidyl-prolyl isomerase